MDAAWGMEWGKAAELTVTVIYPAGAPASRTWAGVRHDANLPKSVVTLLGVSHARGG